jgi:amino acid adenylation domain-containing protein
MAGAHFCAQEVNSPLERRRRIAEIYNPDVVIASVQTPNDLNANGRFLYIEHLTDLPIQKIQEAHEIAYVVFTSGSTGDPKGVMVGRRAFSHFIKVSRPNFDAGPGDRWAQFSNIGHDLAVMDTFMALSTGATLVPLVTERERLMPATAVRDQAITLWQSVPSAVDLMLRAGHVRAELLRSLRIMSFCGAPLLPYHCRDLFAAHPSLIIFNTYGTTETTGFNTLQRLDSQTYMDFADSSMALGTNIPGWQLVLEGEDNPIEGEILINSPYLALGYWNNPGLTGTRFSRAPNPTSPDSRLYRTGDLARRSETGVFFCGRNDRQIKIHGNRVELDEIDAAIHSCAGIPSCTLLLDGLLCTLLAAQSLPDTSALRSALKAFLPSFAIPTIWHIAEDLPRNPNGKVDYVAVATFLRTGN